MKKISNKSEFLFLSSLIPDEEFNKLVLIDKSPQMATHLFYWKFFKGLKSAELSESNFKILSTRPVTEYPRSSVKIVKSKIWKTEYGNLNELFFINYPVIKTITIFIFCFFKSLWWGISTKNRLKQGIVLDSFVPYLMTGFILSKIYKIPLIGIITDPPNMNYKISWESSFKSKFRKLNDRITRRLLKKLSGVIALTQGLVDEYGLGQKNLIIEGIIDTDRNEKNEMSIISDKFIVLYSGSLLEQYGILELIKGFMEISYSDMELWIFGKGEELKKQLIDFSIKDKRIKYFGFLENSKVIEYQKMATLLINPRPTNLPDSNYSFPSKILEYMQSGTPTLLTRLPGIPEEYNEYVFFLDGYNASSMAEKIEEIYSLDRNTLKDFGKKAQRFAQTKDIKSQGRKISQFIMDVTKNSRNT